MLSVPAARRSPRSLAPPPRQCSVAERRITRRTTPAQQKEPAHAEGQVVWSRLTQLQRECAPSLVCTEYLEARERLGLDDEHLPTHRELNSHLQRTCGWSIVPARGYVPPPLFFPMLEQKTFPCSDRLRSLSELTYTTAPDMWHDISGHLPMLVDPFFGEFYYLFGRIGSRVRTPEQLNVLDKVYWFTMEFGVINPTATECRPGDPSQARLYGATLVSAAYEMTRSMTPEVERRAFSIEAVARMQTDVARVNDVLFEVPSFQSLLLQMQDWARGERLL